MSSNEKDSFRKETAKAAFDLRAEGQEPGLNLSGPLSYAVRMRVRKRFLKGIFESVQDADMKSKLIGALINLDYAELGAETLIIYALEHLNRD